ncbi:MAG: SMC family ATPase [Crenarchaeota archaeon]|nr:SMC family ATPase [Thermoproteota archaeon]
MLAFRKIAYEAFRNTPYFEFELGDNGLVVITGQNGCGKTTFIHAFKDALFGLEHSHCMFGNEKQTRIELDFVHNDVEYKVIRQKGKGQLYRDGELYLTSVRDINSYIKGLIDPLIAEATIFLNTKFIDMSDAERKRIIDNLITIDFDPYKKKADLYYRHVNSTLSSLEEQQNILNHQLQEHKQTLKNEMLSYYERIKQRQEQIANAEQKIASLVNSINKVSSEIEEINLSDIEKELDHKRQALDADQSQLMDLAKQQQNLQLQCTELKNRLDKVKTDIKNRFTTQLQQEIARADQAILILKNKLDNVTQEGTSLKNRKELELTKLEQERNNKLSELNNERTRIKVTLDQLTGTCPLCKSKGTNVDLTKPISTNCPICGSKISSNQIAQQSHEYKHRLEQIDDEIAQIQQRYQKDKSETENKFNSELVKLRDTYYELKKELEHHNKVKEEMQARLDQLETEIKDAYQKEAESIIQMFQQKHKQLHDHNNVMSRVSLRVQKLKFEIQKLEQNYKSKKLEHEQKQQYLNQLQQQLASIQAHIQEIKKQEVSKDTVKYVKKDLINTVKQLREMKSKAKDLESEIEYVKIWRKAFSNKGIRALIMSEIVPTINNTLTKYGMEIDLIPRLVVDDKGRFQIAISSGKTQATNAEDLSTGERQIVNVLFNIALSNIFPCNAVFFDEAFDGLDSNNAGWIMAILSSYAKNKETFVITHSPIWKAFECDLVLTPGICKEDE